MNDKDIIAAINYCNANRNACDICPLQEECEAKPFYSPLAKYSLDLINRQRIEIEGLKRDYAILAKRFEQQKEISVYDNKPMVIGTKWEVNMEHIIDPCLICENYIQGVKCENDSCKIKWAKYCAIKKFAEKLKQHKRKMRVYDLNEEFWDYAVLVENIDNLLKETVGEEE